MTPRALAAEKDQSGAQEEGGHHGENMKLNGERRGEERR